MRRRGDLFDDMPNLRSRYDSSRADDAIDHLLSGTPPLPDVPVDDRLVADLVDALTAPAVAEEYLGSVPALTAYRARFGTSKRAGRLRRWSPAMLTSLLGTKLVAAAAAGAVGVGGLAAAAYSSSLPDTAQNVAHHVIGAPAVSHAPTNPNTSSTPVGPNPNGPAGFGLCTAYEHSKVHGQASAHSVAFKNLANAAGGAANIDAFCANIAHPGSSDSAEPSGDTGKPGAPPSHPTGKPSSVPPHPTGKPSTLPTHPGGSTH